MKRKETHRLLFYFFLQLATYTTNINNEDDNENNGDENK